MSSLLDVSWSYAFGEADWVRERLTGRRGRSVTSIVPSGFEAYARVLHPASLDGGNGPRPVRWAEVASASGVDLQSDARFHSVALPAHGPTEGVAPLYHPPRKGSLTEADLRMLIPLLRAGTETPEDCWFCLWVGYAWQGRESDPIPAQVLEAPKVKLSDRDHVLYSGAVEVATALTEPECQTPNVWWPQDRSWCVASDIDLPWTYVGAAARTIDALSGTPGLEILPVSESDPVQRVEEWVLRWAAGGADDLMRTGHCRIVTTRGLVEAWFERPGLTPGALGVTAETTDGRQAGRRTTVEHRSEPELRRLLSLHLAVHIIDLVEG